MIKEKRHLVVIVDDDDQTLNTLKNHLYEWFDVMTFNSVSSLLEALESIQPSLFVIDWSMPGRNGAELCHIISGHRRFDLVPIAFYTDKDPLIDNVKDAFQAGGQSFIPKDASLSFTLTQIRTLVYTHERMDHYLHHQKMMLSVLKHDMSNLLTGVTTGVNILFMDRAFAGGELKKEADEIINASNNLHMLFNDLNEVLVNVNVDERKNMRRVSCSDIFSDLKIYLKNIVRNVEFHYKKKHTFQCDRNELGRALYYIIKFIDKYVPQQRTVHVSTQVETEGMFFTISLKGLFKSCFKRAMFDLDRLGINDGHYDLLSAQYVQNFIHRNSTNLSVSEQDNRTVITFLLPQVSQDNQEEVMAAKSCKADCLESSSEFVQGLDQAKGHILK